MKCSTFDYISMISSYLYCSIMRAKILEGAIRMNVLLLYNMDYQILSFSAARHFTLSVGDDRSNFWLTFRWTKDHLNVYQE